MIKKTYAEKLLDPRWQKKRLEILERDKWECTVCGDSENTLHVHHKAYGPNPWDVENNMLITLCQSCHGMEEEFKKQFKDDALSWVSKSILPLEYFNYFLQDLDKAKLYHPAWKVLLSLSLALNNENAQNVLVSLLELNNKQKQAGYDECLRENKIEKQEDDLF